MNDAGRLEAEMTAKYEAMREIVESIRRNREHLPDRFSTWADKVWARFGMVES